MHRWAIPEKACLAGLGLNQSYLQCSGHSQNSERDHGGSSWGKVTHPGARDEVREFSYSPVQNGLLNTLHIEE